MSAPPPPPPPHGENPKSSGLPPGKYDIFIIPPHSSGSGFLYLPSLKPNVNSFAAGFASALVLVVIGQALAPAVQQWWTSIKGSGGMGMLLLMMAIGVGAWALGRTQTDGGPGPRGGPGGGNPPPDPGAHSYTHSNGHSNGYAGGPPPASGPPPGAGSAGPKPSWQRANPPPGTTGASANTSSSSANGAAKGAWERAREETKRKEEERKAKEAAKKRKEELEKRLKEAREKEAREREAREKKQKEDEAKAKAKLQADEKEKLRAKEREEAISKGSSYAFSATGERTNPWPRGRPPSPVTHRSQPPSPTKRPPAPTARTYLGTDDDAYSFRPYDKPKKPMHKKSHSSLYSESSYVSQSTSRTTPPPSHRGPYSTKDPDKIVIKAVYAFNNAFLKTPTSQLVSGVGSVTDGLILRITTEGLFIDDDVRGVPQREWDVKAWTMKLVEVWCPSFRQGPAGNSASARVASQSAPNTNKTFRRLWGMDKDKVATSEETDALLIDMLQLCRDNCRLRATSRSAASSSAYSSPASSNSYDDRSSVSDSAYGSSAGSSSPSSDKRTDKNGLAFQTGEMKSARLHVLRASIRDQEGKKYVFIITEGESWKVAVGLQKLRKGSQVRALGVSGMSSSDAKGTLEHLGWV
jgi:hypothetical protein